MREGWKEIKFEELFIISLRNGINRPSRTRGKGFKMINMGELFSNDRIYDITMELVPLNENEKKNYTVLQNDLLFARQSIVAEGAGKCSIVMEVSPTITCFESHLIRVRLNEEKALPLFYYYLFQSHIGKAYLSSIRQQGVQAGIRGSDLAKLKLPFPELPTQRKIAQILSAYDDLIENNLRRIALLEEQAQLTYEEWFVRLRFPGFEEVEIVEGLPVEWRKVELKDCAILTMGQSPKSSFYNYEKKGLPFHQGVKDYGFRFPENSTWSTEGKRIANEGDILFSVRAPVGRLNIAFEKIILGRGLASIRHKNNWNSFLFYQLQKIFFQEDIMGGGSIFNSVTKADMQGIKILHATDEVTTKFNDLAKAIDLNIKNLTHQNRLLQEARDILLPRLMLGVVDVD